jgi:putative ABC transport system permease protein
MIKNYILIALRNIWKHKVFSFINIFGLAIGIASAILIFLWVDDQLNVDKFHANSNNLYRVYTKWINGSDVKEFETTPPTAAAMFKEVLPEVSYASRYNSGWTLLTFGDHSEEEKGLAYVDPEFLEMFSYPLIKGDPKTALKEPNSIILSQKQAFKFFGTEDPIGKMIKVRNKFEVMVTGVLAPPAGKSHLNFEYLIPFEFQKNWTILDDNWSDFNYVTYVQMADAIDLEAAHDKVREGLKKQFGEELWVNFQFQPLEEIYLGQKLEGDKAQFGDKRYIYIFSVTAILILLIACINYMNLATARSAKRAREVGVRKVMGAYKAQLISQFYGESILMAFISLFLAAVFVDLLLPYYIELTGTTIIFNIFSLKIIGPLFIITFLTGLIAGSYPALLLSSFKPVKVLKSNGDGGKGSNVFRKVLVVGQFSLSIILIISTIIINQQLNYIQNAKLGYDKEHVLSIKIKGGIWRNLETFKQEVLKASGVENVTIASSPIYDVQSSTIGAEWQGKDPNDRIPFNQMSVDFDFLKTFNIQMLEGRSFDSQIASDTASYIINRFAAAKIGVEDPIGMDFTFHGKQGKIIGICDDFHFKSLHSSIEQMVFFYSPGWWNTLYVKIKPADYQSTIAGIESIWTQFESAYPFSYTFLDDGFENLYKTENRMSRVFNVFSIIAIIISCLGLFGLAAFTAEQKTKEISIRKVLGASTIHLTIMLNRDFSKLVMISFLVAAPLSYYFMDLWLQDFAYRISLGAGAFMLGGVLAFVIAWLTVGYQSLKAALSNPVKSLKIE